MQKTKGKERLISLIPFGNLTIDSPISEKGNTVNNNPSSIPISREKPDWSALIPKQTLPKICMED